MVLTLISWLLKKGHSDLGFVGTRISMEIGVFWQVTVARCSFSVFTTFCKTTYALWSLVMVVLSCQRSNVSAPF